MKDKFPYPGKPAVVTKEMCDMNEGEECYPHYRIINVSPKLIHYGGILLTEEGAVAATYETVEVHVDMATRKSSKMPDWLLSKLNTMKEEHAQAGDVGFELRLKIK